MQKDIKQLLERSSKFIAPFLTVLITYLSLASLESIPVDMTNKDKILHGLAYFSLAISWLFAIKKSYSSFLIKGVILLLVIAYGILMEFIQGTYTDYRMFDMKDVLANSIGSVLALFAFITILSVFNGRFNSK